MSAKFHASLCVLFQGLGFVAGGFAGATLGLYYPFGGLGTCLFFCCLITLGFKLPQLFFKYVLHASCSQCGAQARQLAQGHYAYQCDTCGHLEKTSIQVPRTD